ncbi:uncharacterized protein CIMG_13687 [Coccidioides immitis RS]|uniref:Uncharacterized protein n=1 Tax=Coccidioides immitis (strain RS) TaxID=246410 RepID=A0A0D8JVX4_COCIM|nr:uncharacterized protein CIMG_13687 [Coccidioides immitis RS]KJF61462.1 hypothetical protein CIMG_13687 [Coccidioides immitis RS]
MMSCVYNYLAACETLRPVRTSGASCVRLLRWARRTWRLLGLSFTVLAVVGGPGGGKVWQTSRRKKKGKKEKRKEKKRKGKTSGSQPESQSPRPLATPLHHRAVPSVFSRPARRTSSNQTAPCCCGSGRTAGNQVLENAYGGRRKHRGIRGLRDRSPHLEMMRRDRRSTLS